MKALYPNSDDASKLPESALALKIARHSPCSVCTAEICPGLRPPPIFQLVLDSVEDYDGSESYLESCSCGHDAIDHGAELSEIGEAEFSRRGRVAIRIDELLKVSGSCPSHSTPVIYCLYILPPGYYFRFYFALEKCVH